MFTQLHTGLIGENAQMGMAILPEGYKVVVMRKQRDYPNQSNPFRFGFQEPDSATTQLETRRIISAILPPT